MTLLCCRKPERPGSPEATCSCQPPVLGGALEEHAGGRRFVDDDDALRRSDVIVNEADEQQPGAGLADLGNEEGVGMEWESDTTRNGVAYTCCNQNSYRIAPNF